MEPAESVGGQGALSASGSGSGAVEGPLETPEKYHTESVSETCSDHS